MAAARSDVPLAELTTLRVGGPANRLVEPTTTEELVRAVAAADAAGEPVLLLGGGSNLVVADAGFPGAVIRLCTRGVHVESADSCSGVTVRVAAGEDWDAFCARAVHEGWVGVEALSGIPGLVGAAPIQNVGAYGQQVADTLARVRVFDRIDVAYRDLSVAECDFGYRTSRFKQDPNRFVVLEVVLQLRLGDLGAPIRYAELGRALDVELGARVPTRDVRQAVLALRRSKGMVLDPDDHDSWSAGSFFTNPVLAADHAALLPDDAPRWPQLDGTVKTSAAWLIERAGYGKGYGGGSARLSTKHTLALTNRGNATAAELLALAREVATGVRERFGVALVNEPFLVGVEL